MTPTQRGDLEVLFDEIRSKIKNGEIQYGSAKTSLEAICAGEVVQSTYIPKDFPYALVPLHTFTVTATTTTRQLEVISGEWRHLYFVGYEDRNLHLRLSEFFYDSPATPGGIGTVFNSIQKISPADVVKNVLGVRSFDRTTAIRKIIDEGISFSTEQVLTILTSNIIQEPKHKGVIFFVHNSSRDDLGVIVKNNIKKGLWGKDLDEDTHPFAKGTLVVTRNPVVHLSKL